MGDDLHLVHPRPSLRRLGRPLDGTWDFALDDGRTRPEQVDFDQRIAVPYAPETPAAGVNAPTRVEGCWYRRALDLSALSGLGRPVLHFAGVDRVADVWVDGRHVGRHVGGYSSFRVPIDEEPSGPASLVVRALDPSGDLSAPRGKQDWADDAHAVWYPRTTGIWKSVWVERVGVTAVADVAWDPDPSTMSVVMRADLDGALPGDRLRVRLSADDRTLVDDSITVVSPAVTRRFHLGDGGFDDRHGLLWWPSRPTLVEARLEVLRDGEVIDAVDSTTAMRSVGVRDGRFVLNGRPFQLRMVLDQGYWPATGATPPDVEALRRDIELTKALGFNAVRKHQKTEDLRYYALADRLGLMAWAEMPSAYRAGPATSAALLREWAEVVADHRPYPSIVAWVPINESWGVDACEVDPAQRATIVALRETTRALDPSRPVSANDGWETVGGDVLGVHDYAQEGDTLRSRWGDAASIDRLTTARRPDGRRPDLDGAPAGERAVVLSEFGGTALRDDTDGEFFGSDRWGYATVASADALLERCAELWRVVHESTRLSGGCWTQLTDTYQEVNGLLDADRRPKIDPADVAEVISGRRFRRGQATTATPTHEKETT